ncbi:hypothetical protein LMG19282_03832 [Cupriavidus campinensis]|jgi:hypothetical protein|uniref:Uncharacterized protein n=1 Tax=Cupriavidus campinensis TaxID=151783 RepID=A0AAE9I4P5_9BURK|nr:hypothetical protein [Cupriavidus campinensis]URF03966.1 hypothetical protein M5D45_15995 [Cupriavidus campinensis]CAG2150710.1 hypothetical protein LMG19282_03832 [Cupriavidus campinensis]
MTALADDTHYLYQIRSRQCSSGLGFDGYHGITDNVKRRKSEHFDDLKRGKHKSEKIQAAHDVGPSDLEFWIHTSGTREEMEARERLLVSQPNMHWNKQVGGGPRRGMTAEAAMECLRPKDKPAPAASMPPIGAAAAPALPVSGAAAVLLATAGSGVLASYTLNKTVFAEDPGVSDDERDARSAGRAGTRLGAGVGVAGMLAAVGLAGEVGLSGAAVVSGVSAIGGAVGGGAIVGASIVIAAPAVAALAIGTGVYWLRKRRWGRK